MDTSEFYLDYAPVSYWERQDPVAIILSGVKGQKRRELIRKALERGDEIPEELNDPSLSESVRNALERLDPQWMGGEYLPDPEPGEVEIARISLNTTTGDVYSIYARPQDDGISYRMVDEYEDMYESGDIPGWEVSRWSERPLTMEELIALINGAEFCGEHGAAQPETILGYMTGHDPKNLIDHYTVESDFYPELDAYFESRIEDYLAERAREEAG